MTAGERPRGPVKRQAAAALVRGMIADGALKPGRAAPSGAALARETGYSVITCRAALRSLLADGTLVRGISSNARLRVAPGDGSPADAGALREQLPVRLAACRRARGLTQPQLAALLGVSLTTVGHAETGRLWQARSFWERASLVLGDTSLLVMHDDYAAAASRRRDGGAAAGQDDGRPREEQAGAAHGGSGPCSCGGCAVAVVIRYCDGRQVEMRP